MKYYTVNELAAIFDVHPETIKREVSRKNLSHFRIGSEIRFTQNHVDEYTNVTKFGKTLRENQLEKEIESLTTKIKSKDRLLEMIRSEVMKMTYEA